MKNTILTLILIIMCFNVMAKKKVYNSEGKLVKYLKEDIDIQFANSDVPIPGSEAFNVIPMLPSVVDIAFKLTDTMLENRAKKFTAEYSKQKSNLNTGSGFIPNFSFIKKIQFSESNDMVEALRIDFKAKKVDSITGIVYYIDKLDLNYSSAKTKINHKTFDYTIELKPTFLINGEKKVIELSPIVISSVSFENPEIEPLKHRTDIIPLVDNGIVTEISIKIIESNPVKVRAENILSFWKENKDSVKTIINNYLPKEEDSKNDDAEEGNGNEDDSNDGNDNQNKK